VPSLQIDSRVANPSEPVARAVSTVVERLGFGGLLSVLWTVICVAALWRCTEKTITQLWPWLFWTWVVLAVVWFLGLALAAGAAAIARRRGIVSFTRAPGE